MKHENIEENTTASPASSASLSICCAIGNEETADGEESEQTGAEADGGETASSEEEASQPEENS